MLHQPIDELLTDSSGKVIGVRAGDQVATAPHIIGDPSYFPPEKLNTGKKVNERVLFLPLDIISGLLRNQNQASIWEQYVVCFSELQVVRSICFLDHGIDQTKGNESCQIIIPALQVKASGYPARTKDIYISMVSFAHMVAPKGKYIAIVSTEVETDNPLQARYFC